MTQTTSEYNFLGTLDRLQNLPFAEKEELQAIERGLYEELSASPESLSGLVVMMRCQQMLGNVAKAKAIAHKVWSLGGDISEPIENIYIDNLLNLGMLDMALSLLKPRLADIANIGIFASVAAKFAIATGNFSIIEKLAACPETTHYQNLSDFVAIYKELNYIEHFKAIQKIILETCKNRMSFYEYQIYFDRGFTDVESVIYVMDNAQESARLGAEIEQKINAYFVSSNAKRLNNYSFRVCNIAEHPAVYL